MTNQLAASRIESIEFLDEHSLMVRFATGHMFAISLDTFTDWTLRCGASLEAHDARYTEPTYRSAFHIRNLPQVIPEAN